MKYKILARIIRAFLMLGIVLISFTCLMDLGEFFFNTKRYISFPNGSAIGDTGAKGFYLPMGISVSIPDTSIWYKSGSFETRGAMVDPGFKKNRISGVNDSVTKKVTNTLVVAEKENVITAYNDLRINGTASLKFYSKNKVHNLFWFFYNQFKIYAWIILLISLIKLINIYLSGDFLRKRTFKLISLLGILLVSVELFELLCVFLSASIIPGVYTVTKGTNGEVITGGIKLQFIFGNSISFSNIGIGILIIILSKIIQEAVLIKHENDLTI